MERKNAYLANNLDKYIKESIRIGFTHSWEGDKIEILDEMIVKDECHGFPVEFKVMLQKLTFGKGKDSFFLTGIVTERVEIAHKLRSGGWGSHCYMEESATMELGVVIMAMKHDMYVHTKVCSWPFAKALVSKVTDAHRKSFIPEKVS